MILDKNEPLLVKMHVQSGVHVSCFVLDFLRVNRRYFAEYAPFSASNTRPSGHCWKHGLFMSKLKFRVHVVEYNLMTMTVIYAVGSLWNNGLLTNVYK